MSGVEFTERFGPEGLMKNLPVLCNAYTVLSVTASNSLLFQIGTSTCSPVLGERRAAGMWQPWVSVFSEVSCIECWEIRISSGMLTAASAHLPMTWTQT